MAESREECACRRRNQATTGRSLHPEKGVRSHVEGEEGREEACVH